IRTRKRTNLAEDKAKFKEAKYDSYFTLGAMSDDEDEYILSEGGVWCKSRNVFVSREVTDHLRWKMRDCREAVDAALDPNTKARPTPRVRGGPKAGAPRKCELVHWGMRKWMINAEVLETHQDWVTGGLVLDNGIAWGDSKEP
ncbi:hypothetical protein BDV93DRAFT_408584, partial [Ceratobasidium sp. AG-I]